jgi:glycosyltransferase involved in cell wall biosynthesis
VVGDGPERRALEALAGPTVRFLGHLPHRDIALLMAISRAVVVCAEEDWGMVAIEAAAAGCPTIAANAGGNRETVVNRVTGLLFGEPYGPDELIQALDDFERQPFFERDQMRAHAGRFDESLFIRRLRDVVNREMAAAGQESPVIQT